MISLFLSSCGSSENIRNRYLFSEKVSQLLSEDEYYELNKNAKWPSDYKYVCPDK
jgi:hypothetical protein